MSNVGILTMKDFNRIRKIVDKRKNNEVAKETNEETFRSEQNQTIKNKKEFAHTTKNLYPVNSKHSPSRIPALSPSSKSSLSSNKKSNYTNYKKKSQPILNTENKANKKKIRILPPSLIHDQNKNNKFSKIPFRKIQTFDEDLVKENETKKSTKSSQDSIENEDIQNLEEENNQVNPENPDNQYEAKDDLNEKIAELQIHKDTLNQIEQLNTIPFNKENNIFINDNHDENSFDYRSNILSLQMQIDSLRERRKRETATFQEKALKQKQNFSETSRDLINNDEEFIIKLQSELLKK